MTEIGTIMSRNLLTVEAGLPLQEAARQMNERRVGAALVFDDERLTGILTERDVLRAFGGYGSEGAQRVADWMTPNPETIDSTESTGQAAAIMIHGGFRHLPVVEGGRPVGIVSIRDLMRHVLDDEIPRGA
jgi:CBS domain-containing protein